jgi:hypothetical protein
MITIREGEAGEAQPILIQQCGSNLSLTFAVAADTTIIFKAPNCFTDTVLTVTCCDFAICTSTLTWTPTAAQLTTLGVGDHVGFVNLKSVACSRNVVARFNLTIEDT